MLNPKVPERKDMLSELERRLPGFVDAPNSVGVVFGDGQAWALTLPWLEIRPRFESGIAKTCRRAFTHGRDIDAIIETMADSDDPAVLVMGSSSVAAAILKQQYNLTDAELDQVLCFRTDDPSSAAWIGDVMAVATGARGIRGEADRE